MMKDIGEAYEESLRELAAVFAENVLLREALEQITLSQNVLTTSDKLHQGCMRIAAKALSSLPARSSALLRVLEAAQTQAKLGSQITDEAGTDAEYLKSCYLTSQAYRAYEEGK